MLDVTSGTAGPTSPATPPTLPPYGHLVNDTGGYCHFYGTSSQGNIRVAKFRAKVVEDN